MRAVDIIQKKREGQALAPAEIDTFVAAAAGTGSHWQEYQLSALLMAIFFRGMTAEETAHLTKAMTHSGQRYHWGKVPGPKADKHSTGGVGDKTSLLIAPLAAACGVIVPMMSGRGLGHTGGTLDKLEAIPGFRVGLSEAEVETALGTIGAAMIGQSAQVAPADKKLYSLRDVTATVESIPLITSSILSKKLAEGIDALVMDVKFGCGAFMKDATAARALAESIVCVGNANGVKTKALLTAMNQPLGAAIGNSHEVIECIEALKGKVTNEMVDLSVRLTAEMVLLSGLAPDLAGASAQVRGALTSGRGLEKFRQLVEFQGGDATVIDDYSRLPLCPRDEEFKAARSGIITEMHAEKLGVACMLLGAGRAKAEDRVDHGVGMVLLKKVGDEVKQGETILKFSTPVGRDMDASRELIAAAVGIGDERPGVEELVLGVVE